MSFATPVKKSDNPNTATKGPTPNYIKPLSLAEMTDRRAKGLCYNCDEKFVLGHKCKVKPFVLAMTEEEELCLQSSFQLFPEMGKEVDDMEERLVSMNAMGSAVCRYHMKLTGECGNDLLQMLIDYGSTNNFLDKETASKIGCVLEDILPMLIKVANGQKMIQKITYPVRLLEFEGNQLVLGEDWLKQSGALLNYKDMSLEIENKGRTLLFSAAPPKCKMITIASLFKFVWL